MRRGKRNLRCLLLVAATLLACSSRSTTTNPASDTGASGSAQSKTAVPVKVVTVGRRDLPTFVTGPGRTEATESQDIRAPFDGVILDLVVNDGDHVTKGQTVAWVEARESEAALAGAEKMRQTATNAHARQDAARALELAKRGVVKRALQAPDAGVVLSHKVDEGARVAANEVVATIVASDSIVFVCQVAQSQLASVKPGDPVAVDLSSSTTPAEGRVYGVLPSGSPTDLTAPVRVDLAPEQTPVEVNIFGIAHITVAVRKGAIVVPDAAVLRNDVMGTSRVALVLPDGRATWIDVKPGLSESGLTEIVTPPLDVGTRVVVSGQVGLQDGDHVEVAP